MNVPLTDMMTALAEMFGFTCRTIAIMRMVNSWGPIGSHSMTVVDQMVGFCWEKHDTKVASLPTPSVHVMNPCGEIPCIFTLYVEVTGHFIVIQREADYDGLRFDLNDPALLDKLQEEFNDLQSLVSKITNGKNASRYGHLNDCASQYPAS